MSGEVSYQIKVLRGELCMRPIIDGSFTVAPFEFDSIEELRIERNINEHATLYVRGVAKKDWQFMPVTDATEYTLVKCEADGNVYFSGILESVATTSVDDVYYLEARAISHTIKLDKKKHKRAFQDSGETYRDIVEAIIGEAGGVVNYHADPQSVAKILVQYDETDWQFALRLASHTQDVLTPISDSDEPEFHLGVEDEACAGEIETASFTVFKDFNLLRSRFNDDQPLDEDSVTMYKVRTNDFSYGMYDVGEKVMLNKEDLYVRQAILTLEQAVVTCSYILSAKDAITAPKIYNRNITGLALAGIVQVVENDDLKLDLHIDYKPGTIQFFKYATDYSPESHTGWYVMPEVGDTVFLVFPTEDEKDAHAASSMRQSGTGKTGDPETKFLRTPFGKEVKLNDKEVLITGKDDETYIKINEDSGIEIFTLKPVKVFSNETMEIESTGDMSIETKANLKITAQDSIEMVCGGNTIRIDPPAGIKVDTDKQINVTSTDDINIDTQNNMNTNAQASLYMVNQGTKMKFDPKVGFNLTTDKMINTASILNTMVSSALNTSIAGGVNASLSGGVNTAITAGAMMSLSSLLKMTIDGGLSLDASAKTKLNVSTKTGSAVKLAPQGIDLKGIMIKEG